MKSDAPVILVAEDNEVFLKMISTVLERAGFSVLSTNDGQHALEMFEVFYDDVDLILTDLMMPRINGLELCERVKKEKPGVPLVLITGIEHDGAEYPRRFGFEAALQKPFGATELISLVNRVLRKSRRRVQETVAHLR